VFCGLTNVHPEKTVADAFRKVVTARQEKITEIRKARVEENRILAEVAGDTARAERLARAIEAVQAAETRVSIAEKAMSDVHGKAPTTPDRIVEGHKDKFTGRFEAQLAAEQAREERDRVKDEFELGMGRSVPQVKRAQEAAQAAEAAEKKAADELEAALKPIRSQVAAGLDKASVDSIIASASAQAELGFWNDRLSRTLSGLEGAAAVTLEEAQARRWDLETKAAAELILVENERLAYAAAPAVYKARRYLDVLANGMKDARKMFLAFLPHDRRVHLRGQLEDQARTDIVPSVKEGQ
jgi:hypothetical protein